MSHAAGVGPAFPREVVRAMLLLRANTLALGHSGCRPLVVDRLLDVPRASASTRSCRSRGASGRRATSRRSPTSRCRSSGAARSSSAGQVVPALIALREAGLEPLELEAKEGLALLNGTQLMGAIGALAARRRGPAGRGRPASSAAMSVEALLGTDVAFAAAYQLARPHPGPGRGRRRAPPPAARQRAPDAATTASAHKVQDPYSLRCVPQVHGAVRDALDHLRRVLDIELNSATDNPLVFPGGGVADADTIATGGGRVISGGNFHGEPIALALDFAKLAARRARVDQRAADRAARRPAAQRRAAAVPRRVVGHRLGDDDLPVHGRRPRVGEQGPRPSGVGRLDPDEREPGGPRLDGRDRAPGTPGRVLEGVERILAIELLVAAQALDLRLAMLASDGVDAGARARGRARRDARVRAVVAHLDEDREPGPDLGRRDRARPRRGRWSDLAG